MEIEALKSIIESDATAKSFFTFIDKNENEDVNKLRLRFDHRTEPGSIDYGFAIDQIECRRRAKTKLPRFVGNPATLFPAVVSSEQATDEGIALFHASLISSHERVADLTAGLGIDAMTISKGCREMTAVELDPFREKVLSYNAGLMSLQNLQTVNADSMEWIKDHGPFDTIFIDPARRGGNNSRKYKFADCLPDITTHLDLLTSKCSRLLIKASPLLDLSAIRKELKDVSRIWVLTRKGECKEILIEVAQGESLKEYIAGEVDDNGYPDLFRVPEERIGNEGINIIEEDPEKEGWLYEPSAAVMKISAWGEISRRWPLLKKVGANSHLFYSGERAEGFPGKEYRIIDLPDKKSIRQLKGSKINVLTRNYPLSPDELKKKTGILDGGNTFLIGTRWGRKEKPKLLIAQRNTD